MKVSLGKGSDVVIETGAGPGKKMVRSRGTRKEGLSGPLVNVCQRPVLSEFQGALVSGDPPSKNPLFLYTLFSGDSGIPEHCFEGLNHMVFQIGKHLVPEPGDP